MPYEVFNKHASEYDAWYDTGVGKSIFVMEVDCLKPLLQGYKEPYLEIGVGSGRFARALGIEYGVEPASSLARIAKTRKIKVTEAAAEKLPFPDNIFGGVLMAFTLYFLGNPQKALQEAWRVLKSEGGLILGLILRDSPWGKYYAGKGREGHSIYSRARFFSKEEVDNLLQASGFKVLDYCSTLFQSPGRISYHSEKPVDYYLESAGFVGIVSRKQSTI